MNHTKFIYSCARVIKIITLPVLIAIGLYNNDGQGNKPSDKQAKTTFACLTGNSG
jgi:hypothetical protein